MSFDSLITKKFWPRRYDHNDLLHFFEPSNKDQLPRHVHFRSQPYSTDMIFVLETGAFNDNILKVQIYLCCLY
jgi:hypothetical protein